MQPLSSCVCSQICAIMQISSNRGSLRSMSTSWVQKLSFKRSNTEDPTVDTINSNNSKNITDINNSNNSNDAISNEPETASPAAKRRLRTTGSFKIGAKRIASTVAPGCFGQFQVARPVCCEDCPEHARSVQPCANLFIPIILCIFKDSRLLATRRTSNLWLNLHMHMSIQHVACDAAMILHMAPCKPWVCFYS